MKKPPLRLALSVTVALMQASLLQVSAAPASPSIWQKLSGASSDGQGQVAGKQVAKKAPHVVHATNVVAKKTPAPNALTAQSVATSGMNGQVVLFLGKSSKELGAEGTAAPAAALTIHTALPETTAVAEAPAAPAEAPTLVAMNPDTKVVTDATPPTVASDSSTSTLASNKQLLAQLAPDQIIAQASETSVTPIPPVVSGTVDLEEFKPSNAIDLRVSQSRTFKLRNKIIRTSISDPSIAEPVVVAENQMVLLGKAPGVATLVIWDDAGNSVAVDVRVTHDYTTLQSMLREIDPRIIVRPFAVGGADRVILTGDVDHPESIIRAFAVSNAFMDDRGMNITVANNRIIGARLGEQGGQNATGGASGALSNIGNVDRYTFFGNQTNNITKAQTILSDGGRVTSLVRVRKAPLIVLHCTFLEMNSSAARLVGAQLGLDFTNQNFAFAVGGNNGNASAASPILQSLGGIGGHFGGSLATMSNPAGFLPPAYPVGLPGSVLPTSFLGINSITQSGGNVTATGSPTLLGQGSLIGPPTLLQLANLFGIPGGAGFSSGGLGNLFTAVSTITNHNNSQRWSLNPTLQALISHNRARVLAEPTVVTESGERAAFLVGGEIPILQSIAAAGTAAQSVSFEPFGLRLNCIPVLEENGAINLQVAPEERLVSNALGNNVLGAGTGLIPGFVTRRFQTTVELRPGQELFIAGLVSANHGREVDKIPVLGEIPVLGALYRSKAFSKNESELVVAVRPEIILPGTPGQLKLPEEISKVEGPRDTNFLQVEPTVLDERYMRTGRAEKTLQLPGVLPPDAPIPDNK